MALKHVAAGIVMAVSLVGVSSAEAMPMNLAVAGSAGSAAKIDQVRYVCGYYGCRWRPGVRRFYRGYGYRPYYRPYRRAVRRAWRRGYGYY